MNPGKGGVPVAGLVRKEKGFFRDANYPDRNAQVISSTQKEFPGEEVFRDRKIQAAGEIVFKDRNGRYTTDSAVTPGQETIVILDETPDTGRKEETHPPKEDAGSGVPAGLIWFVCLLVAAALLALRLL